ncbi:hypothetical protein U9M48_041198 [Paspalum notatum var. saurae]|uniref:At1g61320/AtMIF1 LRR domain-containing protein n=1 Tax=Paspalum notatum var. saurae TaxID=547442 RepID=A0AAQ3UNP9_PASNO
MAVAAPAQLLLLRFEPMTRRSTPHGMRSGVPRQNFQAPVFPPEIYITMQPILPSSADKRKGLSCQHQDGHHGDSDSQVADRRCSIPALPEDILHLIHSLLPLRDAARAACSSRAFLGSWRCHPVLALTGYHLGLGLRKNIRVPRKNFTHIIDNILRKHSGVGIKILELQISGIFYTRDYLDSWLQIAVRPGIEGLTLGLCDEDETKYDVPCTLLSAGVRNSIRNLQLSYCAFHPTAAELGPLRNLTSLALSHVSISGDELECFLSNSPALKQLHLHDCQDIVCLKIPCLMLQLLCLKVDYCLNLRAIESKARNLSSFFLSYGKMVKVSLGETLQMKKLVMQRSNSNLIRYARCELPSSMPNLESLSICSSHERVNTPMLPTKFMFLKWLFISLPSTSSSYNHFSLAYFLDASPSLETWLLNVTGEHASIFKGSSLLRQLPEQHHARLKSFKIQGFNSSRGLVELTCYVLKNAQSLDCLTLDTTNGFLKCDCDMSSGLPAPLIKRYLMKARRGATAIRTYIEDKIPPTVKLAVVEPCNQCHAEIV